MSASHLEQLGRAATVLGLHLDAGQQAALLEYLALIQKWTKVYNLTAVRDPDEMLTHHLLDSLAVIAPLQKQLAALKERGVGRKNARSGTHSSASATTHTRVGPLCGRSWTRHALGLLPGLQLSRRP